MAWRVTPNASDVLSRQHSFLHRRPSQAVQDRIILNFGTSGDID
jgi:hypothetical protein